MKEEIYDDLFEEKEEKTNWQATLFKYVIRWPWFIAYRQEIETGPATVRMCVDNTVEEYEAEITEIDLGSENTNKNFVLEITDQRLLQKTGGIVQGNSGSPVLQNGRLIGAITHVFVNHPEKGYGVFAENMLARN